VPAFDPGKQKDKVICKNLLKFKPQTLPSAAPLGARYKSEREAPISHLCYPDLTSLLPRGPCQRGLKFFLLWDLGGNPPTNHPRHERASPLTALGLLRTRDRRLSPINQFATTDLASREVKQKREVGGWQKGNRNKTISKGRGGKSAALIGLGLAREANRQARQPAQGHGSLTAGTSGATTGSGESGTEIPEERVFFSSPPSTAELTGEPGLHGPWGGELPCSGHGVRHRCARSQPPHQKRKILIGSC